MSVAAGSSRIPEAAQCLGCRYPLRGLVSHRCPECGRPFDPVDADTMRIVGRRRWSPTARWCIATNLAPALTWAFTTFWATAALVARFDPYRWRDDRRPFALLVGCLAGALAREPVRRALLRRFPDMAPGRSMSHGWRRALLAALFLAGLSTGEATTAVWGSCPHATMYGAFGIGVARSRVGGPCRNWSPSLTSQHLFGDWYLWEE